MSARLHLTIGISKFRLRQKAATVIGIVKAEIEADQSEYPSLTLCLEVYLNNHHDGNNMGPNSNGMFAST